MANSLVAQNQQTLPVLDQNGLDGYISAVHAIPVLEPDEEYSLGVRLRSENDLQAAQRLVLSHLRFVVHIARGYLGYGLPLADLIQEGNIGLMKAVKRFDPIHNVRLAAFAAHWIKAEIYEFVLRNWRIVKVATTKAQRKLFFNLHKAKQRLGWLNQQETQNIADELGVTPKDVQEMESRLSGIDIAYDAPDDDDDTSYYSPSHTLTSATASPDLHVQQQELSDQNTRALVEALSQLDDRSRDIIQQRWLEEDKSTLKELAGKYKVSIERIRQIENSAIKQLRGAML